MSELFFDSITSPIGTIILVVDGTQVCALDFADYEKRMLKLLHKRYGPTLHLSEKKDPHGISSAIQAYFAGEYHRLDGIVTTTGGTAFQQQVWSTLRTIPVGSIMTYAELAHAVGKDTAYRAVGATNALNPIALIHPCHRVIGANNSLTGYAGGLSRKQWLLQHEGYTFSTTKITGQKDNQVPQQL